MFDKNETRVLDMCYVLFTTHTFNPKVYGFHSKDELSQRIETLIEKGEKHEILYIDADPGVFDIHERYASWKKAVDVLGDYSTVEDFLVEDLWTLEKISGEQLLDQFRSTSSLETITELLKENFSIDDDNRFEPLD